LASVRSIVVVMVGAQPTAGHDQEPSARAANGIGTALASQIAHGLIDGGYQRVHTTWIHDANWRALTLMRVIGAKRLKRYAIFQREFG